MDGGNDCSYNLILLHFLHPWRSEVSVMQEHLPITLVDAAKKRLIPPTYFMRR